MEERETRLSLPDVTLVAVSSVALDLTIRALERCQRQISFGDALLLSDTPPPGGMPSSLRWERIDPIRSRAGYSDFMLHKLVGHVRTSHLLCVQWDGYVLNAAGWDPALLAFDYVGAPWPHFGDGLSVGNGGFSLRSRRLLEACAHLPLGSGEAEDVAICRTHRRRLEDLGLRFAPEALAMRFAYERMAARGDEFGFHGFFNLIDMVDAAQAAAFIDGLEPELLTWREHKEILGRLARKGKFQPAWAMLKRMVRRRSRRSMGPQSLHKRHAQEKDR